MMAVLLLEGGGSGTPGATAVRGSDGFIVLQFRTYGYGNLSVYPVILFLEEFSLTTHKI